MKQLSLLFIIFFAFFMSSCSVNEEELFTEAQTKLQEKKYADALPLLQKIVDGKPDGKHAEEAQYIIISLQHSEMGNARAAIEESRKFVRLFPHAKRATDVFFMIGFIFNNELKQTDSARVAYMEFLSRYPDAEMATSAEFELQNLGKDVNEIMKFQFGDTSTVQGLVKAETLKTK
jgi:TolA-binding protein